MSFEAAGCEGVISSLIKSELGGNQFGVLQMKRMQDLIVPPAVEHFSEVCYLFTPVRTTGRRVLIMPLCLICIRGFMNSLD